MAFSLTQSTRAAGLMVLAGALFALVNTAIQGATMIEGASGPATTFWQYFVALGFFLPWIWRNRRAVLATQSFGLQLIRVALGAVGVQLWVLGLAHVPIWQAVALILLSPLFVTLGAGLVLGEAITSSRWGAVLLGIVGGAIILEPWSDRFTLTALLPVAAAAFWATSSVVTKRLAHQDSAETITIYLLILLTPINFALALGPGLALPQGAVWMVAAAGLLSAGAQFALARAYTLADAAFLQPFDHLKLPFNVGLSLAVFGFAPTGSMWIGAGLIIAASAWVLRQETLAAHPG